MAFEWPLDKLGIINRGLGLTGNRLVNVANDGSDEWGSASAGYELGLAYMMENHSWRWAMQVATLTPAANAPSDDQYDTAYNLPSDMVHLIWCRIADLPAVWDLVAGPGGAAGPSGMQLLARALGVAPGQVPPPGAVPQTVTIGYISQIQSDPTFATPTFVAALTFFVMSAIYRGMHEDAGEADKMWGEGMRMLAEARTRHDQQKPKRAMFNSRIYASRRVRRPFPQTPGGWGGTGVPG